LKLPSHLRFSFPKDLRAKVHSPDYSRLKVPQPSHMPRTFSQTYTHTHKTKNSPVYNDGSHRYRMEIHEYNIAPIAWDRPPRNLDKNPSQSSQDDRKSKSTERVITTKLATLG